MSKRKKSFSPSPLNFFVCLYCRNVAIYPTRDDNDYACAKNQLKSGRYRQLSLFPNKARLSIHEGCGKFESSGLPAHPSIIEELVNLNPLAKKIPVDENAKEVAWEFVNKIYLFPHFNCTSSFMPKKD